MHHLQIGQPAPDFTLPATSGEVHLSGLRGRHVILYCYPKDDTPGCTTESRDFRDQLGRGIERSTFLIDAEGILRREWRNVKVPGHVEEVLATVREL